MSTDKEQAEFRYYDGKGNLMAKLDASAPLVMDWQRGNRIGTLYATTKKNDFNPDWDAMAVMVENSQEQAAKIEQLEALMRFAVNALMDMDNGLVVHEGNWRIRQHVAVSKIKECLK